MRKSYLSLVAIILLSGCSQTIQNMVSKPVTVGKEKIVENKTQNDEKLFREFAKMIKAYYGDEEIYLQTKVITNQTGDKSLPVNLEDMIKTTISKIGSPIVFLDSNINQNKNKRAKYIISGAITEYDRGIKRVDSSVIGGLSGLLKNITGDLQAGVDKSKEVTSMAVDLHLIDYETSKQTDTYSSKKAYLFENRKTNRAGFYLFGTGLEAQDSITYKSAKQATVRKLIEVAFLELLAKELKLPYWKLTKSNIDKELLVKIKEEYKSSNNKIRELQKILQKYGFSNIVANGELNEETKSVLKRVASNLNLDSSIINEELLSTLWINIPFQKELKYNQFDKSLHYPNDIPLIAKEIDSLKYKKVKINSIIDKYTKNRTPFSDELKLKLVKYLNTNTSTLAIDSSKENTRTLVKRKKGVLDVYGFFEIIDDKIVLEFKIIDDKNRVVKTIKESFSNNKLDTSFSSAKIAQLLKINEEIRDDTLQVTSSKDENNAIYFKGEEISFEITTSKNLYLHIFNINSKGDVEKLTDNEQKIYQTDKIYKLPEDGNSYDVEPPYGNEGLKFIATTKYIPFPTNKSSLEVIDYFKTKAKEQNIEIYEKSILIETREK